jgi:hypothetical protein
MANTTHGPYAPTTYASTMTKADATNLETQAAVTLASFNPDLIGAAFVESGVACVKDATTTTQLNVTSGKAYLLMTDGTNARIDVASTTFSAFGHPATTLFLDLNPDGSWSFASTHSAQANFLPICQVTTDGSSNITGVADKRVTQVMLLANAALTSTAQPGGLALPSPLKALLTQSAALAGTVNGGVTFGQVGALRGSMGGAASFDGTTGYVSAPTTGLPTANAVWSLEAWIKISALTAGTQIIVNFGTWAVTRAAPHLAINSSGGAYCGTYFGDTAASGALGTTAWHHVMGTWDGTTLRCYVDGTQTATATPGALLVALHGMAIGSSETLTTTYFNGTIDEVAVYNTTLSAARVTAHYNAGLSTTTDAYAATVLADAPLRYYRLGDAVGATSAAEYQNVGAFYRSDAGNGRGGALQ